jgi:L-rhamnose mutarotase
LAFGSSMFMEFAAGWQRAETQLWWRIVDPAQSSPVEDAPRNARWRKIREVFHFSGKEC